MTARALLQARLLLQEFEIRLALAFFAMAVLVLLFSSVIGGIGGHPALVPIFAMAITAIMRLPKALTTLPAPVTTRQRAWIPMAVWLALTLEGAAVMSFCGLLWIKEFSLPDFWAGCLFWSGFTIVPIILVWRLISLDYNRACYLVVFAMIFNTSISLGGASLFIRSEWRSLWPFMLGLAVLLVLEAPRRLEWIDKMDALGGPENPWQLPSRVMSSPTRQHWLTRLANCAAHALVLVELLNSLKCWLAEPESAKNRLIITGSFSILCLSLLLAAWVQNRASGMSRARALVVLLLRATLVFEPWKDMLGVGSGSPESCGHCKIARMPWLRLCPHCGGAGATAAPKTKKAEVKKDAAKNAGIEVDMLTSFYRFWTPILIAWGFWSMYSK